MLLLYVGRVLRGVVTVLERVSIQTKKKQQWPNSVETGTNDAYRFEYFLGLPLIYERFWILCEYCTEKRTPSTVSYTNRCTYVEYLIVVRVGPVQIIQCSI